MKLLTLLIGTLLLSSCSVNGSDTNTSVSHKYKEEYTNVYYSYNDDLTYVVEIDESKQYTLSIDSVYYVKKHDSRIKNKFYVGVNHYWLVIYANL